MSMVNIGILAHVDAGKTSLTERLLYTTGVIDRIGSVDAGNTQTDSMALERERGITIKSAVVSFAIDDVTVNLIDTPGHPDFIAEVERVLSVLDGAVLVISAVEGVQPQTRVLMRALQRLRIPTLLFINKIDRRGADVERTLQRMRERLSPALVLMGASRDLGERTAEFEPFRATDSAFITQLAEQLTEHDDRLLAEYIADERSLSFCTLYDELAAQTKQALVHPVFVGSAITGAGIDALIDGIKTLLPASTPPTNGPVSGTVFKIERGAAGEKIAFVRLFAGTVAVRERLLIGQSGEARVTALAVFENGAAVRHSTALAGQIAKIWGLSSARIGDTIGVPPPHALQHTFAPPTLETVIVPCRTTDRSALAVALGQLAEQDPLINLRRDDLKQELFVSLYGEVQKEVIQATLMRDYGIEIAFLETSTICVERPIGVGEAVDYLGKGDNPFLATVGLRIEPAPIDSGIIFQLDPELAAPPMFIYKSLENFQAAMTETVRSTLEQGLYGWQVTDCLITMIHSGYTSPASGAGDFRKLTPLVLMAALQHAGTVVCEPIQHFRLEVPAETFGAAAPVLAKMHAIAQTQELRGATYIIEGVIPAARVHELQQHVPTLTRGEGVLESAFDHYQPLGDDFPIRPRSDANPLNRKEYLLRIVRRV